MKLRTVRTGVGIFLVVDVLLVIWPGLVPFNRVRPFIFGLPFVMAWLTLMLILTGVALLVMEVAERRAGNR